MEPTFKIISPDLDPAATNLICEVSESSFNALFQNNGLKTFTGLLSYQFKPGSVTAEIPGFIKSIISGESKFTGEYNKVFISYSDPQSVLLPASVHKPEMKSDLICSIHGERRGSTIFTDLIAEKNIFNIYRISSAIHHCLNTYYPVMAISHQYSTLIKHISKEGTVMQVIFYTDKFVVILSDGGELKIIQSYQFTSPQDIIYTLLNILQQFNIRDPNVRVSGMIDNSSDLHKTIRRYFHSMEAASSPAELITGDLQNLPGHYFSHLYDVARCV